MSSAKDPRRCSLAERSGEIRRPAHMRDTVAGPPKERPSRKGFKLHSWPPEHLAFAMKASFSCKGKALLTKVNTERPDIGAEYLRVTGRPLTVNVLMNRVDKGKRYNEMKNYEHLL